MLRHSAVRTSEVWQEHTLKNWLVSKAKQVQLLNVLPTSPRLEGLLRILPTRRKNDYVELSHHPLKFGDAIHPGHYLVRQPFSPHSRLRPDGSPVVHAPPAPWTRKHWAGGKIHFAPKPLLVGLGFVRGKVTIAKDAIKPESPMPEDEPFHVDNFHYDAPEYDAQEWLPIVKTLQRFIFSQWYPQNLPLITEEREIEFHTSRYDDSQIKTSSLIPPEAGILSFAFKATRFLLSSFCHISHETHRIHLDLHYAKDEGYPDLVIPVPLLLITMLDTIGANLPDGLSIKEIQYEIVNPLFAMDEVRVYIHQVAENGHADIQRMRPQAPGSTKQPILIWTTDEHGVVGIAAKVFLRFPEREDFQWNVGTAKGGLVYHTTGAVSEELDLKTLEDDDSRILEETVKLLNDPQGDPLVQTNVPRPSPTTVIVHPSTNKSTISDLAEKRRGRNARVPKSGTFHRLFTNLD